MAEFLTEVKENLSFILVCIAVAAALAAAGRIAEHFMPQTRRVSPASRISIIGICAAIATVLHIFDFSLPFLAPEFYKLDFSELPVMLCGFYLGPSAVVACEGVKILLKLLIKGTSTAFVGDFSNFVIGCSLALPAVIIYHTKKSRFSAMVGLATGTVFLTLFGSAFNGIYLIPKFAQLFYLPVEQIVAMGNTITPHINSLWSFVLFAVAPLNLIKGITISLLTLLLYKRVARPLFGK